MSFLKRDEELTLLKTIYQAKRVFISGHTGFKGSWLALWLAESGADVIGYSLDPPTDPNNFQATELQDKITHIRGDVCDLNCLLEAFRRYQPEFVFHLAAQPIVRLSYNEPKMTFDTNVGGTVNIFEAVRLNPSVKVLVNITSDKCYENKEWVWGYRENDPMGGHDPYSASKGCAELVFNAYLNSFFSSSATKKRSVGAASARAGNVIGGGDWGVDRLVPDCIRALHRGQTIGIRNPHAIRPWQHVLEPLYGYLQLGAALRHDPQRYSGAWNFGSSNSSHLTVGEMADRLIQYWGNGSWKDLSDPQAPHEATLLKLNCDKAHAELNWRGVLTIDECLLMTADWYKEFYSGSRMKDMYQFCVSQIRNYEETVTSRR